MKFYWQYISLAVIAALLFTGCTASWRYQQPLPPGALEGAALGTVGGAMVGSTTGVGMVGGAVIGGISGGVIGSYLAKQQTLVQKITANHVQIILIGDNLRLILPTDLFFAPNTPVLNENYYLVLNQIAQLLRGLDKYVITVAGHTDNTDWPKRNLALSRQQAQVIANYLWNQGMNARVLYATGYGSAQPIASNNTAAGCAMNRRIEINLREIMDDRDQ